MKLTLRDREVLQFINAVGWCTAPQLKKRFSVSLPIAYRIMRRLMEARLVLHQEAGRNAYGIYYLSSLGAGYTDLPPIERISNGIFHHQKKLVDVILKLCEIYPDAVWVSERHLIQQKFYYGVGRSGHVSDGVLIFPDGSKISIEVELSLKSQQRLRKIFNAYAGTLAYKEVWYYCADNVMRGVTAIAGKKSFIKIFSLRGFLNG